MTPKFVLSSDLHLDTLTWTDRPTVTGDAYNSFAQIVVYCVNHRLPLLLAGDLWNVYRPPAEAVYQFCRQMDRMQAAALGVFVIQGQHGLDRQRGWHAVHAWPQHVHEQAFHIPGLLNHVFYGLDWLPAGELQAALAKIPANTFGLLCHQVWKDLLAIGRTDGCFADIPAVSLVMTGDYHVHKRVEAVGKDGQAMQVFSPGSISLRAINEDRNKAFWVASWRDRIQWQSIPLVTRPLYDLELRTQAALDDFCIRQWPAPLGEWVPLVRVTYTDNLPDAYNRITEAFGDRAHVFWNPLPVDAETVVDFEAAPAGAFDDLLSAFEQLSPPEGDICRGASRLLLSQDPAAEYDAMFKEFNESTA